MTPSQPYVPKTFSAGHCKALITITIIKSLKSPSDNFDIRDHISFTSKSTRSGTHHKLIHPRTTSAAQRHFYFNRIVRLYNYLLAINISLPTNDIKCQLIQHLWTHFSNNFNSDRACTFHIPLSMSLPLQCAYLR